MNKLVSCIMLLSLARPLNVASLSTSSASKLFAARGSAVWSGSCALFSTSSKTEVTKLPEFASKEDYITFIESQAALPQGFSIGTAKGTFVPVEAPMLGNLPIKATVVKFDEPTESWAACFTKNKFPGAPIKVGRKRLASGGPLQALVINNKVSNVCSGGDGEAAAELVCKAVAEGLSLEGGAEVVLPSSTGVIGWRLPAKELAEDVVPKAIENIQSDTALSAANAIMTTDRYPKLRSCTLSNGARLVGIAKGAGMIEPNMATMLSYLFTDTSIDKSTLQSFLSDVVDESYNSISVDGSESTSDTVVVVSTNKVEGTDLKEFRQALAEVCTGLASDIVRNGEGTGHVMRVDVKNYPGTDAEARRLGKHVANSPLFKCAVSGNDPNIGRLAAAIGSFLGRLEEQKEGATDDLTLTLGGRQIFAKSKFILEGDEIEQALSDHMSGAQFDEKGDFPPHQRFVEIGADFGAGKGTGCAVVLGSDLTQEYVVVNADYRS